MPKPLVMLGAGGHSNVLAELLLAEGRNIIAIVSPKEVTDSSPLSGIARLTSDESVLEVYQPEQVELVNGIGSIPMNNTRLKVFNYFSEHGYYFASVISPYAMLSKSIVIAEGVQVMSGAILQSNANIGVNSIINSGAIIEHDCSIGAHNHIAPGATLSGGVITGRQVHIGTGANIIQGIEIGHQAIVGAGCTVVRDVPENQVIIPAHNRILR